MRNLLRHGHQWSFRDHFRRGSSHLRDGSDETVTLASHGFDEDRLVGRVLKDCAKLSNRGVDTAFGVHVNTVSPEARSDFFAADELPRVLDQENQQLHGKALELHRAPRSPELKARDV
jgi:hypothetical protein